MSFRTDGLSAEIGAATVTINVEKNHRLMQLANTLDWEGLVAKAMPDLQKTSKGLWWRGRPLFLRVHMGAYLLQSLFNETDRGVENRIKFDASFQAFCGCTIVPNWSCPGHTKIAKFRNRIAPETQRQLIDIILDAALKLGFADPTWMDVDSTVQEANVSYPSDAVLLTKLTQKCKKVFDYIKEKTRGVIRDGLDIDMNSIGKKAKGYFFLSKNAAKEKRKQVFKELHQMVKSQVYPFLEILEDLDPCFLKSLPWNIARDIDQVSQQGKRYLLDVAHFIRNQSIKAGKILSWHAHAFACIKKGKLGKDYEFGRVFQLGRIGGNYMIAMACETIGMNDKQSLAGVMAEHVRIFGSDSLASLATDKGYYSAANVHAAFAAGVSEVGIQCPGNVRLKGTVNEVMAKTLRDRRAGIEPLIGHVKQMGLKRSRMKSDSSTLASGYRCVLGFNLRQLGNHLIQDLAKVA